MERKVKKQKIEHNLMLNTQINLINLYVSRFYNSAMLYLIKLENVTFARIKIKCTIFLFIWMRNKL